MAPAAPEPEVDTRTARRPSWEEELEEVAQDIDRGEKEKLAKAEDQVGREASAAEALAVATSSSSGSKREMDDSAGGDQDAKVA